MERAPLIHLLRERVDKLPEGHFKRRMKARVKLLEEVPPEAFWAIVAVIITALSVLALGKIVWRD